MPKVVPKTLHHSNHVYQKTFTQVNCIKMKNELFLMKNMKNFTCLQKVLSDQYPFVRPAL